MQQVIVNGIKTVTSSKEYMTGCPGLVEVIGKMKIKLKKETIENK